MRETTTQGDSLMRETTTPGDTPMRETTTQGDSPMRETTTPGDTPIRETTTQGDSPMRETYHPQSLRPSSLRMTTLTHVIPAPSHVIPAKAGIHPAASNSRRTALLPPSTEIDTIRQSPTNHNENSCPRARQRRFHLILLAWLAPRTQQVGLSSIPVPIPSFPRRREPRPPP